MTSLFCNTSAGRLRVIEPFGALPAGYRYLLERDNGDTRVLTEEEFRGEVTIDGKQVALASLVAFADGWRTI